jgi:hypothetical protein
MAVAGFAILTSFAVTAAAYVLVCIKERSWINAATPHFFSAFATCYLFELIYIADSGYSNSLTAYLGVYFSYAIIHLAFALAYVLFNPPVRKHWLATDPPSNNNYRVLPWLMIVSAFGLFAPIAWQFKDYLLEPRLLYMRTRTGFGPLFYTSDMLARLGLVLLLTRSNGSKMGTALGFFLCLLLSAAHGSKGVVLALFFIWVIYTVYARKHRFSFVQAVAPALLISAIVVGLVAWTFLQQIGELADPLSDVVQFMTAYTDYNRNAMMVIDDQEDTYGGKLTFETAVYAHVPRFLMPDKPKNFGGFYLAEKYYPAWFYSDTGSPDFGIGVQFADFGFLAPVYLTIWAVLSGAMLRLFVDRFKLASQPGDFVMLLFFAEVPVFGIGGGYPLPENLIVAFLLNVHALRRLRRAARRSQISGLAAGARL